MKDNIFQKNSRFYYRKLDEKFSFFGSSKIKVGASALELQHIKK
jgi:hypothetical protein